MGLITKQQYIIVGFDPGLADTGFGVIEVKGDKLTCLDYGSLRTPAKVDLTKRLCLLHHKVGEILNEYKPDLVGIEQLFFCRNVTTAFGVGQARGVVMLAIGQHSIPYLEFTPLQVKQAVVGYGQGSKQQVQRMVKLILNLKIIPKPDDAADALAIALCAAQSRTTMLV